MFKLLVLGHIEWCGSLIILEGDISAPGEQEVNCLLGGGPVQHSVMKRSVAETVHNVQVGPGIQQETHDVRELGSLDRGFSQESRAA